MNVPEDCLHPAGLPPESVLFGCSDLMAVVKQQLEAVASASVPVLLEGESGTGKELLATTLHEMSQWRSGPMFKVNCAAIPGSRLEDQLFATNDCGLAGKSGSAPAVTQQGTLLLNEISELAPHLQSKLLQALHDDPCYVVRAQDGTKVKVRLICATTRSLSTEVDAGRFRGDLYYRINVVTVRVPALRDRQCDVPILARHFVRVYNEQFGRQVEAPSPKVLEAMHRHTWPGNVRELENVVKRYVILGSASAVTEEIGERRTVQRVAEPAAQTGVALKQMTKAAVRELERKVIVDVLEANQWNRKRTARALNISYRALLYKLRAAGVSNSRISADELS